MRVANQQRTFLRLLAQLRPHWRRDAALPTRIHTILGRQRSFGARDRRLYRELIYTTLRYLPWIEPLLDTDPNEAIRRVAWLSAETAATREFRAAVAIGEPFTGDKSVLLPKWFRTHCPEVFSGEELEAQLRRAPLWLRLQAEEPQGVFNEFAERGWDYRRSEFVSDAVEVLTEADVTKTMAWASGQIEVQDLGSQMILESIGLERGGRWLDACAGAGGKTLQLARLIGPAGMVDAHDIRAAALVELKARVTRARISNVRMTASPTASDYDGVLVDAPCSGSGTWRRAPHLKWVTMEAHVARAAGKQLALLREFSARVKPGGRLVYATCSLSARENEDVVAAFLGAHPEFRPEPFARTFDAPARGAGRLILPAKHDTDGFFVASLRRA